ncbi:hypothetical protein ACN22W_35230 [Burkholderia theae]|uniref:hypothetical protein n=1 Tax=Burkholderia theae TaxID=3143496 RepID=UPI003AFA4280
MIACAAFSTSLPTKSDSMGVLWQCVEPASTIARKAALRAAGARNDAGRIDAALSKVGGGTVGVQAQTLAAVGTVHRAATASTQ